MSEMMAFPDTWEEFEKSYGFTDNEEVYTNGARLIPSFRVKQWLDQLPSVQPERKRGEWIYGENDGQDGWYCSECGLFIPWYYDYYGLDNIDFIADFNTCPKCDTKMLKYTGMRGDSE